MSTSADLRTTKPLSRRIEFVDGFQLLLKFLCCKSTGNFQGLGVVSDADVAVAARCAACAISSMRVGAIAGGGMHVEIAHQVLRADELGKLFPRGRLHLAATFAKFRLDVFQTQGGVDRGFVRQIGASWRRVLSVTVASSGCCVRPKIGEMFAATRSRARETNPIPGSLST